ncbi:unnamed protein product [Linum tenue]|uniref:FBD domain-containing protein n=1 Tax=Linum tenue TaxID=586396 RepID=A0AAV0NJC1_9ROSI|nr:unnamed protein product [Linum tenue]
MVAMCASLPALQQLCVSFEFLEVNLLPYVGPTCNFANTSLISLLIPVCGALLKLLAEGSVPYRLPAVLHHLRVVEVGSCSFPHYDGLLVEIVLFCLIRSSPNLHTLTMQMEAQGQAPAIPRQEVLSVSAESEGYPENEDGCFQCLREVRILGSHGSQLELDVLKFVLAKAALLRRVVIKPSDELGCELGLRFLKEVTQYRRVSKDAEVIYVV